LAIIDCAKADNVAVLCVAFSSDGNRVITGTDKQDEVSGAYAKIWALEQEDDGKLTHREILYLTGHTAAVTSVAFSPDADGSRALTGSEDYIAKLWDTRTEADIAELASRNQTIEEPLPIEQQPPVDAPNPTDVFAALAVKPAVQAKEILSLAGHLREVTTVAFSQNGEKEFDVLTGSRDGKAILWLTTGDWKVKSPQPVKDAAAKPVAAGTVTAGK
jgi:WD40 repeat protein